MNSFDSEKKQIVDRKSESQDSLDVMNISMTQDFSEIIPQNKSFLKKIFDNESNIYNIALFTVINTALGPGFLALPHAIANWGLLPGFFMLIVGGTNMYISLKCLCYLFAQFKSLTYSDLAHKIYGMYMETFVNVIFSIYSFGVLIANYLVRKLIRNLAYQQIDRRYFFQKLRRLI